MPNTIHGAAKRGNQLKIYRVWVSMVGRCEHEKHKEWKNYGGRGIRVCQRWLDYRNFIADMGAPPSGHSLERRDNNAGYCKENCVWATPYVQARNRRTNRFITIGNFHGCFKDVAKHFGIGVRRVYWRINAGWSIEDAFTKKPAPVGPRRKVDRNLEVQPPAL